VVVATDSEVIAACVEKAGGRAVMTRADHPSGSDRIFEALAVADPQGKGTVIVNVQADLPNIAPSDIAAAVSALADPAVDIATLAAEITRAEERTDPNVVKLVGTPVGERRLRALYFTRAAAPAGEGPLYHHIGLYAFRRAALARFVALSPSPLEQREKLEQLRALEAGMRIDAAIVASVPLGVDTPADLERAREILGQGKQT
jgi:3-deoxy-manno-octulosonate cytidylyltransferase (CMP-KDO synthetase)